MQKYAKVCKNMQSYAKNFLKVLKIWNKFSKQSSNNNKVFQVI